MQINAVNLLNPDTYGKCSLFNTKADNVVFGDILREVEKHLSLDAFIENVEKKGNAKITFFSDYNDGDSLTGLNNVIISQSTLEKMKDDKRFYEKIMKTIDEFCSPDAQQERMRLSPPVKGAWIIIYPDGSYMCILESIYSESENTKKINNIDSVPDFYEFFLEKVNIKSTTNFNGMVGLGFTEKKKSK